MENLHLTTTIPEDAAGKRLDQVLSALFPAYSREKLKSWIISGACVVNHKPGRPKDKVQGGEKIVIQAQLDTQMQAEPDQTMRLNIIFEDPNILVLNKPDKLVVHPGNGHAKGTLLNGLLGCYPELEALPRAGIVHRLDKNTTGLMVVARTLAAHEDLVAQLQARTVKREYVALVQGLLPAGGRFDLPIARDPHHRKRMCVSLQGKPAITHYRVKQKYQGMTYLTVTLETGRTHQIRVHMAHTGHPIIGDQTYARRGIRLPKGMPQACIQAIQAFPRQTLHAQKLGLKHPSTGLPMLWEAPIPDDLQALLSTLARLKI